VSARSQNGELDRSHRPTRCGLTRRSWRTFGPGLNDRGYLDRKDCAKAGCCVFRPQTSVRVCPSPSATPWPPPARVSGTAFSWTRASPTRLKTLTLPAASAYEALAW